MLENETRQSPRLSDGQTSLNKPLARRFASVEDLLRFWEGQHPDGRVMSPESPTVLDASEKTRFRRMELGSWFLVNPKRAVFPLGSLTPDVDQLRVLSVDEINLIKQGNLEEWCAHFWFDGAAPAELDTCERIELDQLVELVVTWAELDRDNVRDGRNPDLSCVRPKHDPLMCCYRTVFRDLVVTGMVPVLESALLSHLGFKAYKCGSLNYWVKPSYPLHGWTQDSWCWLYDCPRPQKCPQNSEYPLAFCHGLGMGISMYISFVHMLMKTFPGSTLFLISAPHISMRRVDHVPSMYELAQNVKDMLHTWGFTQCHLLGHSFGTLLGAGIIRYAPDIVRCVSMLDPVCFLINKTTAKVCQALYIGVTQENDPHAEAFLELMNFYAFSEIYTTHALQRGMVWQDAILSLEEIRVSDLPLLVICEELDPVIPVHCVNRLFWANQSNNIQFRLIRGASHGGFLLDDRVMELIRRELTKFHPLRSNLEHPGK